MASKRITLTKAQLATAAGDALLALLLEITADGDITLAEVQQLEDWLAQSGGSDIPAMGWLRDVVDEIVEDGRITLDERRNLILAIERVMPKSERDQARERRQEVERISASPSGVGDSAEAGWMKDPATERQTNYILALGGELTNCMTKGEASTLIDRLLGGPPNRQMMVLRFWDRVDLAGHGRQGVSQWMDAWYGEDEDRQRAWALWKKDNGDTGGQDSPNRVPIGASEQYLRKQSHSPGLLGSQMTY